MPPFRKAELAIVQLALIYFDTHTHTHTHTHTSQTEETQCVLD